MTDDSLERPPVAPIVAVVVAGVVGILVLRWLVSALFTGIRLLLVLAVIVGVVYAVSRLRKSSAD